MITIIMIIGVPAITHRAAQRPASGSYIFIEQLVIVLIRLTYVMHYLTLSLFNVMFDSLILI